MWYNKELCVTVYTFVFVLIVIPTGMNQVKKKVVLPTSLWHLFEIVIPVTSYLSYHVPVRFGTFVTSQKYVVLKVHDSSIQLIMELN